MGMLQEVRRRRKCVKRSLIYKLPYGTAQQALQRQLLSKDGNKARFTKTVMLFYDFEQTELQSIRRKQMKTTTAVPCATR